MSPSMLGSEMGPGKAQTLTLRKPPGHRRQRGTARRAAQTDQGRRAEEPAEAESARRSLLESARRKVLDFLLGLLPPAGRGNRWIGTCRTFLKQPEMSTRQ